MSVTLIRYVLLAALRDRFAIAFVVACFMASCLSLFFGSAAVIEKNQFVLVFAAGSLRLIGVFGLILFVVFFIRRSFDGKEVEYLLSRPVNRVSLMLSFSVAFFLLAMFVSTVIGVCVLILAPHLISQGHVLWIVSIFMENIMMVNTAMFFSMYIASASGAVMITTGFYVLARMMGQLLGIVDSSLVADISLLSVVIQMVSVIVPRLDLMGQSSWLLYGAEGDFSFLAVILQGVIFTALVVLASLIDLVRRQF